MRAGEMQSEAGQEALGELIQAYWYPLYAFSRRQGTSDHDAMDLTQGFFTQLLASDGLGAVSPEKGRFRSFLLASFKNFASNQRRAAERIRRGGAVMTVSLSHLDFKSRYEREPTDDGDSPELVFDRHWVEVMLQRVSQRLADDYRQAGKEELFRLLSPHLGGGADALPRPEIGRLLNLSTAAVAMSIHRMRRRFGHLLRQEVAGTVSDPDEIEDELRTLMQIVGRA